MTAATAAYPHLFRPITVGPLRLPNRIVMGSMHTGLEDRPEDFPRLARFYAERARGGAALIVTGGFPPNREGGFDGHSGRLDEDSLAAHRLVTEAVHAEGGRILLQILHTGRYGLHDGIVAPSPLRAPINRFTPREMTDDDILRTIGDFGRTASLARRAGYDGVEVMGSEGYLLNQFTAPRTNRRADRWGGMPENRLRFPLEVLRAVRRSLGPDLVLMYRVSLIDLVPDGSPWDEAVAMARVAEQAGADLLNTGIGWHEARVPTIAHMVPRGAWGWVTARLKGAVSVPVVTSNRYDTPVAAEAPLAAGAADMVSMARPFLADPHLLAKARTGRAAEINTCIACNQACLDAIFSGGIASCIVNPRACREDAFAAPPMPAPKRLAVVGGGPAGLAFAAEAAERGHSVTLFEASAKLGGQFRLACRIPGKRGYAETIRYFENRLERLGVAVHIRRRVAPDDLDGFDEVVLATGVRPRLPEIAGIDHPSVASYLDILTGAREAGAQVAIIGAGGIGFDTALYLLGEPEDFYAAWGIDRAFAQAGGLAEPAAPAAGRRITLLQRKTSRPGAGLGKTTGWVHRAVLERSGVEMLSGVSYRRIDDAGLHVTLAGEERLIPADTVVVCAGQEPLRDLHDALATRGRPVHLIGGADIAAELDAGRAIEQATRLALRL